jgi:cell division protein FtsA
MQSAVKHMKNVFALDLGTTKFVVAALRDQPGRTLPVVETVSVPAEGMRRGMLANVEQAKAALRQLLDTAERQWGADIGKVVVGVAGGHLQSRVVSRQVAIAGAQVAPKDIQSLVEAVEATEQTEGRELLHTVPIGYRIDQRETIDDPLGFGGRTLAGDFFLIDADRYYLKDIVDVCNAAGLQVERLYSEPFASASVTVPDDLKQLGLGLG